MSAWEIYELEVGCRGGGGGGGGGDQVSILTHRNTLTLI